MGGTTELYLTWLQASGAAATTVRLRAHYLYRLHAHHRTEDLLGLTTDDLAAFLSHAAWQPETRKSARAAVRGFYRWAHDTGRLPTDPSRLLPSVRVPPGKPRPTPSAVLAAAMLGAPPREQLMLLLASYAGLRRGEIAKVHTRDVVDDSLRVVGKGGRTRVIPLHPVLHAAILSVPEGYVFPGRAEGHLSAGYVGKLLARRLGHGWTAHTLRHAFASRAYAGTHDLLALSSLLGHTKAETTQRYVALPDDALRAAVMAAAL